MPIVHGSNGRFVGSGRAKGSVKRGELAGTLARARSINSGRAAKGKAPLSAARLNRVALHVQKKARATALGQYSFEKGIIKSLPKADRPSSHREVAWGRSAPEAMSIDRRRDLGLRSGKLRPFLP